MNISLTKFCKDHALPKSTVYRRCGELNIDTSDGVSPADCDRLLHEFDKTPEPEKPQITVESGNHQIVLAAPQLPQTYSLESLRLSTDVVSYEDPLAVAAQFIEAADQLSAAMEQDLQQRAAALQRTVQAKEALQAKALELKIQSKIYREEAAWQNAVHSAATAQLQQAIGQLQPLGKPAASES